MADEWQDVGSAEELEGRPIQEIRVGRRTVALSSVNGEWGAVSGVCNHAGGPLGQGRLDGEFIVCPWHYWKYHRRTGVGEPGSEDDLVPSHDVKVENGRVLVSLEPRTRRHKVPHAPHPLTRPIVRSPGAVRVAGISTTVLDAGQPRYSGSEALLEIALEHAATLGSETRMIRLHRLRFRACEGFYSKAAEACTWPCSITQMDAGDEMTEVYEALVHWADVVLVATPIRWGAASSLYFKMVERLNCVQNQVTTRDRVLIRDKVAAFIIVGGQDNVQAVAGQMLGFFAELGFTFPQFPFIAHSRGWTAEDMDRNVRVIMHSQELRQGAMALAERAIQAAARLVGRPLAEERTPRGGRKAHRLDAPPAPEAAPGGQDPGTSA